jgi:starvation-inducible DNA-binding protein
MATAATSTHLPPLGPHVREEVGRELQATLVELVDLSLVGKQLHWSIVGPLFTVLHEKLDELIDSWRDLSDVVAERAFAIGTFPDGQADAVVAAGERTVLERGGIEDRAVVRELARRLADAAERIRGRMDRLGELDAVSQDVLVEVLRELEKQLWMVRAQLPLGG